MRECEKEQQLNTFFIHRGMYKLENTLWSLKKGDEKTKICSCVDFDM